MGSTVESFVGDADLEHFDRSLYRVTHTNQISGIVCVVQGGNVRSNAATAIAAFLEKKIAKGETLTEQQRKMVELASMHASVHATMGGPAGEEKAPRAKKLGSKQNKNKNKKRKRGGNNNQTPPRTDWQQSNGRVHQLKVGLVSKTALKSARNVTKNNNSSMANDGSATKRRKVTLGTRKVTLGNKKVTLGNKKVTLGNKKVSHVMNKKVSNVMNKKVSHVMNFHVMNQKVSHVMNKKPNVGRKVVMGSQKKVNAAKKKVHVGKKKKLVVSTKRGGGEALGKRINRGLSASR